MPFKLSQESLSHLSGVDERLAAVVKYAIGVTKIDFGVTCGLRSVDEQRRLVAAGASQTMRSKHIDGLAVDVVAWIGPRISWGLPLYDDIADAFKEGADAVGVPLRWGAAWHIDDIRSFDGTMEQAMNSYIDARRAESRRPFLDAVHFEVST